jgi:hypothetical protein
MHCKLVAGAYQQTMAVAGGSHTLRPSAGQNHFGCSDLEFTSIINAITINDSYSYVLFGHFGRGFH